MQNENKKTIGGLGRGTWAHAHESTCTCHLIHAKRMHMHRTNRVLKIAKPSGSNLDLKAQSLVNRTSTFELQPRPSAFELPTSSFVLELRHSTFELRRSDFQLRTSSFELRTSNFELRASRFGPTFELEASNFDFRFACPDLAECA